MGSERAEDFNAVEAVEGLKPGSLWDGLPVERPVLPRYARAVSLEITGGFELARAFDRHDVDAGLRRSKDHRLVAEVGDRDVEVGLGVRQTLAEMAFAMAAEELSIVDAQGPTSSAKHSRIVAATFGHCGRIVGLFCLPFLIAFFVCSFFQCA